VNGDDDLVGDVERVDERGGHFGGRGPDESVHVGSADAEVMVHEIAAHLGEQSGPVSDPIQAALEL
jgi:hypothetical protein